MIGKVCSCRHDETYHTIYGNGDGDKKACIANKLWDTLLVVRTMEGSNFCYCMDYDGDSFHKMIEDLDND